MPDFREDQAAGLRRLMSGPKPRIVTLLSAAAGNELPRILTNLAASFRQYGSDALIVHAADANAEALKAFRASIDEAASIVNDNPEKGRQAIANFTKIPMDVLSKMKLSVSDPKVEQEQLDWWVATMNEQNMLQGKPDTASLIQK